MILTSKDRFRTLRFGRRRQRPLAGPEKWNLSSSISSFSGVIHLAWARSEAPLTLKLALRLRCLGGRMRPKVYSEFPLYLSAAAARWAKVAA